MLKESKYFFFVLIIFLFFSLLLKFYFSESNKKNSYRSINTIDIKIEKFSKKLKLLANDTNNIAHYVEQNNNHEKKSFNFWKLINDND
jgi:hypothetical protein